MKRAGSLWSQIVDLDNIKVAHRQARRGKAYYTEVKMVDADLNRYAAEIQRALLDKTFTTSAYEVEERHDGRKLRTIYKLPYYPDRIVQHALLGVIGPILTRSFIRDTFQSIIGRGTSDAMRRVRQFVRSERCPPYALKIDIEKYYPSVDNEILKAQVRRKIKCADTLWLLDNVIDSMQGLPIGNYTSQHLGNLYLNEFDWWIKQVVKPAGYFRYCDDIVVFGDTRDELRATKDAMRARLAALGLSIKPNWTIYNVEREGVDFVGYVFKSECTRLRPSIARKFRAACRQLRARLRLWNVDKHRSRLMAYKGWMKPANAKRLWRVHTQKLVRFFPKQLRSAI
jgi:hypothetical protein